MDLPFEWSRATSIAVFLPWGVQTVAGSSMVAEFERLGLARFRVLIGSSELVGALGLLASYWFPGLVPLPAGGLALLMALGLLAQLRRRDSLDQIAPALALMLLNGFLVAETLGG